MDDTNISKLREVNDFESLVSYLIDELDWPIEATKADDITYKYDPQELGIDDKYAAGIEIIRQFRPISDKQPWGIFYIEFDKKKLPVVLLRRILRSLVHKQRTTDDRKATWDLSDLIFISSTGEVDNRKLSFAHFTESETGSDELKTFSWDDTDTYFHYMQNVMDLGKLRWPINEDDTDAWNEKWSSAFRLKHGYVIRTSKDLASKMAQLAIRIRDSVFEVYHFERTDGPLHKLFNNFKEVLIHDLTIESLSDMYAQTITYGLFSAKATHKGAFEEDDIVGIIPNTNPFLKELFQECTRIGEENEFGLDIEELGVIELIDVLKETDIESVLADFGKQKKGEDPVIHFYEDFLFQYDPDQKINRGEFYTPDSVVTFIVRSVDYLLKNEFNLSSGLADISTVTQKYLMPAKKRRGYVEKNKKVSKIQILDPAVGTGTFLKHTIEVIKNIFHEENIDLSFTDRMEKWNLYIDEHLLNRIFGFELLLAPYAISHLKVGLELSSTGYNFEGKKRLGIFLTNTLEGTHEGAGTLDSYSNWLANEVRNANLIKSKNNISIILGNPPYKGHSMNTGIDWIEKMVNDYKKIDGEKIDLGQAKWINNDYVKFIRFGQWRIDKTGYGILAFITDNSFLDRSAFPFG